MKKSIVFLSLSLLLNSYYYDVMAMAASDNEYKAFTKLLETPRFRKGARYKELEALAAYLIRAAINRAKTITTLPISSRLELLVEDKLDLPEARKQNVKNAKAACLADFEMQQRSIPINIVNSGEEQRRKLFEAELCFLENNYARVIMAIDALRKKTNLPRELTVEILSTF